MKIVSIVLSVISYIFGVLFVWGAFGEPFDAKSLIIGIIMLVVGSALLWIGTRNRDKKSGDVVYKVDLGGDVNLSKMACKHCGGPINPENVTMIAGAPTVTCPFCGQAYTLTEEPKW